MNYSYKGGQYNAFYNCYLGRWSSWNKYILERFLTLYCHYPLSGDIDILLIEHNEMRTGTHSVCQPDHLLVNTVACQITLFADDTVKGIGPIRKGPNFYQWAIQIRLS